MTFEQEFGIRFGDYYVVEVSMRPNNPPWRALAFSPRGDTIVLAAGGLERDAETYRRKQFYSFRVVEKIQAMSDRPERFMPDDTTPPASKAVR